MKKKVFSLMALALFMASTVNLNANTQKEIFDDTDCWAVADATQTAFETAMLKIRYIPSHLDSFEVWEAAYLNCIN